jgi:hypothetical protein
MKPRVPNGYLRFLKSLSQYQQRAEIGRLAFTERRGGSSLQEDLLLDPAMITYSKSLGVNPALWEFDLRHYAEEPDVIGAPVFCEDEARAPFTFRYEHVSGKNLVITGIIYVDDNRNALIGTLACSSTQEQSSRARRLVAAGIDPDTLETVSHSRAKLIHRLRESLYLDYLNALLPQQRRDAIFDLADVAWGTEAPSRRPDSSTTPLFLNHPKLAPELARLEIRDLCATCKAHDVGPVEFKEGRCTAPLTYYLYGDGELSKYDEGGDGYFVEVHILAGIGNKPGGRGDISIENMWFRIYSLDDPEDSGIALLVP